MTAQNDVHILDEAAALAADYASHEAAIEPHKEAMDRIKTRLKELFADDYGQHPAGELTVSVGRNPQFQAAEFAAAYPVTRYPHLYKAVPDSEAIKEHLSPAALRGYQSYGQPKIGVK